MTGIASAGENLIAVIEDIEPYLHSLGASRLNGGDLILGAFGTFVTGWHLPVRFAKDFTLTLVVLLPAAFPFAPPRLAVRDGPELLDWPHLEPGGMLCVFPTGTSFDTRDPLGQVKGLLGEGSELIQRILAGESEDDFREEVLSYWSHAISVPTPKIISLLEPSGGHRQVAIWRGKGFSVVAETAAELQQWMRRRYGAKNKNQTIKASSALFLLAPRVPLPREYPTNAAGLRALFASEPLALWLVAEQALQATTAREIVIGLQPTTGFGLIGLTIRGDVLNPILGMSGVNDIWHGFRRGQRMPRDIAIMRASSARLKVVKHDVERADHTWVHGRDHDVRQTRLRAASVLLIGCGSLGSSVAEILARAGVGNLYVMDGETLDWPNLGRNALGAQDIKLNKAGQLAARIAGALPHLHNVVAFNEKLRPDNLNLLDGKDVVLSTTGNWQADSLVNLQLQRSQAAIGVYAWLEPHALAAHAVTVPLGGACFACNMGRNGQPHLVVTAWPDEGTLPVPACGGIFTPYGAAELAFAHAMVSEQVLAALLQPPARSSETIWVGNTSQLLAQGGAISANWRDTMGEPGAGRFAVSREWQRADACPVCGRSAVQAA